MISSLKRDSSLKTSKSIKQSGVIESSFFWIPDKTRSLKFEDSQEKSSTEFKN
jgi:hypothetical protein